MNARSWEQKENFAVLNWILLLDEICLFFALVYLALPGGDETSDKGCLSIKALCGAIAAQLDAIRVLGGVGHDFQVRVLARSFGEYADVLTVALSDREFAAEFFNSSNTNNDSNKFWHQHIAKGRLKKRIERSFGPLSGLVGEFFQAALDYEREEERRFSSVLHPSYAGAAIGSISGCGIFFTPHAVFGGVGTSMVAPLHYVFNKASFALLWQRAPWRLLLSGINNKGFLTDSITSRFDYLRDLFFFVLNNDEHPALAQDIG